MGRIAKATTISQVLTDLGNLRQDVERLRRGFGLFGQQDALGEAAAWKAACSAISVLPGLRGFWPMSSFDENGDAFDLSGQGRTLSYNGDPTYNYDGLAPYIDLDGTGDFLSRDDEAGLDILGTEAYVAAAARGLTMGGYIFRDTLANNEAFMAKRSGANDGYALYAINTGAFRCVIGTGAAEQFLTTADTFAIDAWRFIVLRFDPGATISIFVDNAEYSAATAIAAINNSAAAFQVGRLVGGNDLNGRTSLCFLCAAYLSDAIIRALFAATRGLFRKW